MSTINWWTDPLNFGELTNLCCQQERSVQAHSPATHHPVHPCHLLGHPRAYLHSSHLSLLVSLTDATHREGSRRMLSTSTSIGAGLETPRLRLRALSLPRFCPPNDADVHAYSHCTTQPNSHCTTQQQGSSSKTRRLFGYAKQFANTSPQWPWHTRQPAHCFAPITP